MYARIVRASLTAETAQEAVMYFQNTVLPALKQHAGFVSGYCFYAPTDHHMLMVSVWESEEARLSAETSGLLHEAVSHLSDYFEGKPTVDYYQVAI
ncbi:antibiotic biosynthesis monooxygenase family protein [Spirosoma lituiforme]